MMEIDELIKSLLPEIKRVSRKVGYSYGDRFESEDIAQGVSQAIIERPSEYARLSGSLLAYALRKAAVRWCEVEKAKFLTFSAEHIYSSEELKRILPIYFGGGVWPTGLPQPKMEDYNTVEDFEKAFEEWYSSGDVVVIEVFDLDRAFKKLSGAQQRILRHKYQDGKPLVSRYERNKHAQAMRWLTYNVNNGVAARERRRQFHEGPGSREVVSNQKAALITHNNWDRDGSSRPDFIEVLDRVLRGSHPDEVLSRHVVNSPWR